MVRRLIVFDLDGTLVDSHRDIANTANALVEELGGQRLTHEAVGRMVGEGAALLVARAMEAAGLPNRPAALTRYLELYDERLLEHTRPYPGVVEALEAAQTHGALAVLTNKPLRPSLRILEGLGLRHFFGAVLGGDGPHPRKPDPSALLQLAAEAGVTPDTTLLVGDSAADHKTARAAGARCCIVRYGFGSVSMQDRTLADGEWAVTHTAELPAVFQAFASGR